MGNETETIVTVETPAPLESAETSELLSPVETSTENPEDSLDDVATVADEILVEVKECQTQLNQTTAALETLQSEGGPAKSNQIAELQTEVKNLREEMRNLLAELKALQQGNPPPGQREADSLQSTPLPPPVVAVTEINPVVVENPVERTAPKKKRYRI